MSTTAADGTLKLTWEDLLIEEVDREEFLQWCVLWGIEGQVRPVFLNQFGSLFIERREGPVDMLDVLNSELARMADSKDAFRALVNTRDWAEVHLLSKQVYQLHLAGIVPEPGYCYGLVPHPLRGGPRLTEDTVLEPGQVRVLPIHEWQTVCVESARRPGH